MATPVLPDFDWRDSCLVHERVELDKRTRERARAAWGQVPEFLPMFAVNPWVSEAAIKVASVKRVTITNHLADLIALVVSQESSCRFCYGVARSLLRIAGMDERRIQKLERDIHDLSVPESTRAALEFSRKLARVNPRPGRVDVDTLLAAGFTGPQVREIVATIAENIFFNRLMTLAAVQPGNIENIAWGRASLLTRPLTRVLLRPSRAAGAAMFLDEDVRASTYGSVLQAIDGTHQATGFAAILEDAFASTLIPPRSKAMIFAVVARALQCEICEVRASSLLEEEGMAAGEISEFLAHLTSPQLTPLENRIVPLARETVRANPAQIQPKMAALIEDISPPVFLEFAGTVSLANAMARLSFLVGNMPDGEIAHAG